MRLLRSFRGSFLLLSLLCGVSLSAQDQAAIPNGISLPMRGNMFAIDRNASQSSLVQLHAEEIVSNAHAASNFMRSMVYSGPRGSIELKGINAETHLHGEGLSFLARLSEDETDLMRNRLTLVRLKQTTERRVVSVYSQNVFGGQRARQYDVVPVTKSEIPESNWVKLTPDKPLGPGEYGIIIMPKDPTLIADAVYDFNVDFDSATIQKK